MYTIRPGCADDLHFYQECFNNPLWRRNYGVWIDDADLDTYIRTMANAAYPSVQRLMVLQENKHIAFCHVNIAGDNHRCTISGGVKPTIVGQGFGIIIAACLIDHIFHTLEINKIVCRVLMFNRASYRMLRALGFVAEGTARSHDYDPATRSYFDVGFWGLLRCEYPNPFVTRILERSGYVAK